MPDNPEGPLRPLTSRPEEEFREAALDALREFQHRSILEASRRPDNPREFGRPYIQTSETILPQRPVSAEEVTVPFTAPCPPDINEPPEPEPPEVNLVCDSIEASKSKCGAFPAQDDLGAANTIVTTDCASNDVGSGTVVNQFSVWRNIIWVYTGCTDGMTGTLTIDRTYSDEDESCDFVDDCSGSLTKVIDSPCPATLTCASIIPGGSYPGCASHTTTVSDEYTTEQLIENTVADLPAYDEDYNDTCSATRALTDNDTDYFIRRFKYKFTFSESEDFRIDWNEHFVPTVGSPTDTAKHEEFSSPATESSVYEVLEPATNGTTTITDVVVTAL